MNTSTSIPDSSCSTFCINSTNKMFILDPLSVIIKLAIIGYKKIGTKIFIHNNVVGLQEPGVFQSIVRFIFNNNKQDLHFLYNPIEFACKSFLTENNKNTRPGVVKLFECALSGLTKLKETYKNSPISILALDYYYVLITNYLYKPYNKKLFKPNDMTLCYSEEFIDIVNKLWTDVKIQAVTDLNGYLLSNDNSLDNSNCLEIFMRDVDSQMYKTIEEYILPKVYQNATNELNSILKVNINMNNIDNMCVKNIQPFKETDSLVEVPRSITESSYREDDVLPVVAPSKDNKKNKHR
jgi:hypothetical protein